jgi:hypothetical protein
LSEVYRSKVVAGQTLTGGVGQAAALQAWENTPELPQPSLHWTACVPPPQPTLQAPKSVVILGAQPCGVDELTLSGSELTTGVVKSACWAAAGEAARRTAKPTAAAWERDMLNSSTKTDVIPPFYARNRNGSNGK